MSVLTSDAIMLIEMCAMIVSLAQIFQIDSCDKKDFCSWISEKEEKLGIWNGLSRERHPSEVPNHWGYQPRGEYQSGNVPTRVPKVTRIFRRGCRQGHQTNPLINNISPPIAEWSLRSDQSRTNLNITTQEVVLDKRKYRHLRSQVKRLHNSGDLLATEVRLIPRACKR